jgi:NADP-dependent 3-hydroxy acid dehydrogenase YdfG
MDYKNALITGASSGMGRGIAARFAKAGVRVYAAARRLPELEALKAEVGDNIVPLKLDVSDADATEARVRALDEECGGLDLVVANAGIAMQSNAKRINWERVSNMLKVNVLGATATLCGALPGMVQRGRGHLVGISSVGALGAAPRLGAYCGTKSYLSTLLQGLRMDCAPLGIRVSTIQPGYVKSEMTAENKAPMPFLMETDEAVDIIVKAIQREAKVVTFPWQLSVGLKTLSSLPRPLYEAAAKRMR